jgi:hypothetical protein
VRAFKDFLRPSESSRTAWRRTYYEHPGGFQTRPYILRG